ncbi:Rhomboid-like protein 15 [Galdieria sulphuraria]|uniref:Rhomboid domain-containing protein 1 n=1 Tax=Galdieria sulphuraria TaxID=130081 RepID=M2XLS9_GALSU|nr:rhomboid domain-containing protein 1 [Galdieria sulphuraria]EME31147.1 rhomboid domain-containing protein 1 [Galdieria sulphuraria]GJD12383.1 Rhomboid-like protein 15 [Galdieria sulphuraria]|eukprot:XP_005707667.1 rhomboid domain-containing protein 1 [Galdieria sulphuraria]
MQTFLNGVKALLLNFPGTTLVSGSLCSLVILLYLLQTITKTDSFFYCVSLEQVFFSYRVYLLFIAPLLHSSFWHLLFNVIALLGIGPVVESRKGSTLYGLLCLLLLLVSESLFLIFELLIYLQSRYLFFFPISQSCVVGFSGLLFALFVIDCIQVSVRTVQLFGRIPVRSNWIPWIFLLLIQAILPGVSFLGHLSGIFAGYIYILGGFDWILPSCERLHQCDDRIWFANLNSFVLHNDICCSAAQPSGRVSNFFSYQSLCPSNIRNWFSWKTDSSEDIRFPGKGHRLGDDSSVRLISAQVTEQKLSGKESGMKDVDERTVLAKTEGYGSACSEKWHD